MTVYAIWIIASDFILFLNKNNSFAILPSQIELNQANNQILNGKWKRQEIKQSGEKHS